MSFAKDQHAVGDLGAGGEDEPFRVRVRPWALRWDLAHGNTGVSQHGVEGGGELAGPIADQDLEPFRVLAKVHEQIPCLLGGPQPVRVRGDAEDMHVTAADLQDEEDIQALEGERAVDVEVVAGEHGGGLGGQEPSPGGVVAAYGCGWDAEAFEDPADGGRADPVAEAEQFALHTLVAPTGGDSG